MSALLPTTWCSPRRSRGGWKYHSVRGRAAYSKGGGVVSPAPRALRTPPARKEPPLAMSRRWGSKTAAAWSWGWGQQPAGPALGWPWGAVSWKPVRASRPQSPVSGVYSCPGTEVKARRARPGEACAALIPKCQPSCCPCPEVPQGRNPFLLQGPWHLCLPCSRGVPGLSALLPAFPPALGRIQPAANPATPWHVPLEPEKRPGSRCWLLKP